MATCDRIRTQLANYAVGGGNRWRRGRLQRHLDACAGCRRELAALTRTGELLSVLPLESAPPGTWEAIRAHLASQPVPERRVSRGLNRPRWRLALAAAVLMAIGAGLLSLSPRHPVTPPRGMAVVQTDPDMQDSVDGHLLAARVSPMADEAAYGLALQDQEGNS